MRSRLDRPAAVCTAAVSLVTAVAAIAPSTARADDSLQAQVPSVAAVADAVTAATTAAIPATPVEVTPISDPLPGLEPAPASESAATTGSATEQTPEPTDAEPSPTQSAESAPEAAAESPEPASQNGSPVDITPTTPDIAADTPATSPHPSPPAQAPAPARAPAPAPASMAANVNVSVRIGSAGDNGPVTQVNVGSGTTAPLSTATPSPPAEPRAAETSTSASGATTSEPAAAVDSDTWYWSWDCLGSAPLSPISPSGSTSGSFPSSWTWIWNCGDNHEQYQSETPSGYQQINTNITIRISSPGNDGSVTQVNVGAGLSIPLLSPVHGGPFAPSPVLVPSAAQTMLNAPPAPAEPVVAPVLTGDTSDTSTAPVPLTAAPAPQTGTAVPAFAPQTTAVAGGVPFGGVWVYGTVPPGAPTEPLGSSGPATKWVAPRPWPGVAPAHTASAEPRGSGPPAEATPRLQPPPLPDRAPVISASGVSAAAAGGGGGSSGSGLPVLLMLPFVAALLDLARRVALEHATWPSGHRRRVPDTPG
jgi:hypothetical protein